MPYIQFQHRRGTAATWTSNNPVLASGEMGLETDSQLFKMGDGTTAWTSLGYGGLRGYTGPIGNTGPTGPSTNPATWAAYPASAAINAGGYALTNASSVNGVSATPTVYNVTTVSSSFPSGITYGITYDASSGNVYVVYTSNSVIYKVTPAGVVTILAGSGTAAVVDGTGTNASFGWIRDMTCDSVGNIYVDDNGGNSCTIRKVTPAGVVTTIAGNSALGPAVIDGTGTNARFSQYSYGLCIDPTATFIYASDWTGSTGIIRKINLSTNAVTSISLSPSISTVYPRWDATTGTIIGVSGQIYRITTTGTTTQLTSSTLPLSANNAGIDANGNIYMVDYNYGGGGLVWKYTTATNTVAVIAGNNTSGSTDGLGTAATFSFSSQGGITADPSGNIYVADNGRVRKLTALSGAGGILHYNGSLYTSNTSTALTVQAPLSYRYVTSNVSGTSVDLTASSNLVSTTFRLTAGPSNTITFPSLASATSGSWWTFSNAYTATQTLTLAGTTTGLTSPYSLSSNTSLTIYSDGSSYRTVTGGAVASAPTMADSFMIMGGCLNGSSTSNKSFYSYDGITWTSHVYPSAVTGMIYPVWNGQYWLFVASGVVGISSDGINFTLTTVSGINSPPHLRGVSWNGKMWMVIGGDGSSAPWYSYDGMTWAQPTFPANNGLNCVGWGKDKFIAGGNCGGNPNVFHSYDGLNWISQGSPFGNGGNNMEFIQYNGTLWVGVGRYMNFMTSPDGLVWTTAVQIGGWDTNAMGYLVVNGQYNIGGFNGGYASSNAGKTWSIKCTNPLNSYSCMPTWNGNAWYMGIYNTGGSTNIYTSPNGYSNWTQTGTVTGTAGDGMVTVTSRRINIVNASTAPVLYQGALTSPAGSSNSIGGVTLSNSSVNGITISNGQVGGVTMSNGAINNVPATPTLYNVTTFIGNGTNSATDGTGTNATVGGGSFEPMAYSPTDSNIYFGDGYSVLRRFNAATGVTTTLAGNAADSSFTDGTGTTIRINTIQSLAFDQSNNLYIGDFNRIRKYVPSTNTLTTVVGNASQTSADGTGTNAVINRIFGMVFDATATNMYFIDFNYGNNVGTLRKYVPSTGVVTTLTMTGTRTHLGQCYNLSWDTTTGTFVGTSSFVNQPEVFRVTTSGAYTQIANLATLSYVTPLYSTIDSSGNIYFADPYGSVVSKVAAGTSTVTQIGGTLVAFGNSPSVLIDGIGAAATLRYPGGIAVDSAGNVYAYDVNKIRKLSPLGGLGGILPYNGSLYTSTPSTALTVQAPLSYRYATSNVSGTSVDLTASSNYVGTTYRLTAGPANTITFPGLASSTSGSWWSFSNAYSATQTLTLAGTTTGLTSPISLSSNTTVTIYSDGSSYRTVTGSALPNTINGVTLANGSAIASNIITSNVSGGALGTMTQLPAVYGIPFIGAVYNQIWCSSNGQYVSILGDDVVRVSSNYGVTWTATTQGLGGNYPQFAMSANGAVIAGTNSPLVVSSNYGATWSNTTAFNGGNNTVCVSSNGSVIYAAGGGSNDIWVSSNTGTSWAQLNIGAVGTARFVYLSCSSNGSVVLAQTQVANTVVSSNYGATWVTTTIGGTNSPNSAVSPDGLTIYSASGSYPSVSSNYGSTFTNLSNAGSRSWSGPPLINSNASVVIIPAGSNLWIATGSPVNASSTWTSVTTPVTFTGLMSCSYDGNFIVARQVPGYAWTSTDRGTTWTQRKGVDALANRTYPMYGGVTATSFDGSVAIMGLTQFAATTSNAGQTWNSVANSAGTFLLLGGAANATTVSSNGTKIVLVDTGNNPYISSNTGSTWSVISGISGYTTTPLTISPDGNVLLVTRPGAGINLSTNGGSSWTTVGPAVGYYSFATSSNGLIQLAGGNSNVYISSNTGSTWTAISTFASASGYVAMSYDGTRMVVAQNNGYIWWSSNSGATWTQATSSGSQSWAWISMSADGTKCAAAPGSGNNGAVSTSLDGGVTWAVTGSSYGRSYGACVSGDGSVIYGAPYYGGTAPYAMRLGLALANPSSSFATISNLTAPTILGSGSNSNVKVTGNELIVYPGSTSTSNYGAGYDTLTLQTTTPGYGGGVASLAFANSNTGYPLGRVYAVDTGIVPQGSGSGSLVFQSSVSNQLVSAMTISGSNVTVNGTIGGVTLSGGAINNVTTTQDRYVVTTFAGNGSASDVNGVGTNASIMQPEGIHYSALTNTFYTSSRSGAVRMIDLNGNVTTLASGLGGGLREGITTDRSGNVYVVNANTFNTVGRITSNGVVTVFAGSGATASTDGTGTNAAFNNPYGIVCDPTGTYLYVSDASTHKIRRIVVATGVVTTIAGSGSAGSADGVGTNATFSTPTGLAIDSTGDVLYICGNNRVRRLVVSTGVVTTVAGNGSGGYTDGTGTNATLFSNKVIVDPVTGNLFACGNFGGYNPIRMITLAGVVTTIAGSPADGYVDGVGTDAVFASPSGIAVDTNGLLYIADNLNHRIRKITSTGRVGGVLLTNGTLTTAGTISIQQIQKTLNTIASPGSGTVVANWSTGDIWYVTSMTANFTINLTNLPTVANKSYSVVFALVQGATPYYISALQIAGVAQTIKWPGASAPTATASRVETETFTLMYTGAAWTVLGQLTSFG